MTVSWLIRVDLSTENILASIEENQPGGDRQEWEEELPSNRQKQGQQESRSDKCLAERIRRLDHTERKYTDNSQKQVLKVVDTPAI